MKMHRRICFAGSNLIISSSKAAQKHEDRPAETSSSLTSCVQMFYYVHEDLCVAGNGFFGF